MSRSYHNLTAHYNAFFNGREAYKQGIKKVDNSIKDDFTTFIPVFTISNEQAAKSAASEMETALTKSAKVIKLHSITARPKRKSGNLSKKKKEFYNKPEFCNWVDDSWFLTGKSKLVNHDLYGAEEAFEYIVKQYSSEPIKYDASIWLARTYTQMGKFSDAKNILDRIEGEKEFPKRLFKDLTLSYADMYVQQKKYEDAIPKLKTAIKVTHKKKEKARYYYILAQIYQYYKQYTNASDCYTQVTKFNPPYEMIFNAQINRATCFDFASGNAEQIRKQLSKMLRDDKNIDYKDQIYYAIANLYQKENETDKALELYKLSARSSISNSMQKALSFLAIADIYFGQQKYILSQNYYDSTMSFIDPKYPDFAAVDAKSKNLTELVKSLLTIQNEDSLQKVATMSERDRNRLIDNLIAEVVKAEELKQQEEQQQQINSALFQQNQQNQNMNNNLGGKWYFYNPTTLSFGLSEFKKKWGTRKLEDDWRRKNKAIIMPTNGEETADQTDSVTKPAITDNKKREYYLQNLPINDSLIKASNQRIEDAYFNSGEAYMIKLKNFPLAISQFETLARRFPNSKYLLQAYFDMYNMNKELKNEAQADKNKNYILQQFPESNYAHMLSNPNYLKELEEKKDQVNQLYDQAYQEFINRNYFKVFSYCKMADSLFSENYISAKFGLLKALSTGGTGDVDGLKNSLSKIIEKYPGTEEKTAAESILAYVSKGDYTFLANQTTNQTNNQTNSQQNTVVEEVKTNQVEAEDELYKVDDADAQYFIILLDKNADIYTLKYNLFGYNIDYFSMFDFEISTGTWSERYQLIKVKPFSSRKEAVKYYKSVNKHKDIVFKGIDDRQYKFFVISEKNIGNLQTDKDMDRYLKFFTSKYLEKGK
jgi:tetratricopeptide (TPR) repeat protein